MKYQIDYSATAGVYSVFDGTTVEAENADQARQIGISKARAKFRHEHPRVQEEPEIEVNINKPKTNGKI